MSNRTGSLVHSTLLATKTAAAESGWHWRVVLLVTVYLAVFLGYIGVTFITSRCSSRPFDDRQFAQAATYVYGKYFPDMSAFRAELIKNDRFVEDVEVTDKSVVVTGPKGRKVVMARFRHGDSIEMLVYLGEDGVTRLSDDHLHLFIAEIQRVSSPRFNPEDALGKGAFSGQGSIVIAPDAGDDDVFVIDASERSEWLFWSYYSFRKVAMGS